MTPDQRALAERLLASHSVSATFRAMQDAGFPVTYADVDNVRRKIAKHGEGLSRRKVEEIAHKGLSPDAEPIDVDPAPALNARDGSDRLPRAQLVAGQHFLTPERFTDTVRRLAA